MIKSRLAFVLVACLLVLLVVSIVVIQRNAMLEPDLVPTPTSSASVVPIKQTDVSSNLAITATRAPLFAYYYIWFDPKSWDRAKIDLPELGKYSSDDEQVLRQHVRWAKEAGIDGFIVGWKSTPKLNARLEKMLQIADEENFKILMIYQALDFERNPLAISTVGSDMDEFIAKHMKHPSLKVFPKPVMIWSGTWKFSAGDIESITKPRRNQLLILGTAKNIKDYRRVAASLDGNAYYWSSVDLNTNDNYESKLSEMAEAVHQYNGLWIAPAAPGFDARLVGGTKSINRNDGQTLREQMRAANQANPDVIGLISWNEFSENTYIEPSQKYGHTYVNLLKEIRSAPDLP